MRQVAHRVVLLAKRASSVLRRGIVRWFPYVPGKIAEVILQGFIDLAPVPDIALVEIPFPDQPGSKLRHVDERFDFLNASRAPLPLIALNLGSPTVVSRPPVQCQLTQPPQYAAGPSSRFLKRPLPREDRAWYRAIRARTKWQLTGVVHGVQFGSFSGFSVPL